MGKRGPAPKPLELRVLEGNRGHRPIDFNTVFRPEAGVPDAPKWLLPESRKAWLRLVRELAPYNLVSRLDRDALAMLCQTIGRVELLEKSINGRVSQLVDAGKDPVLAFFDKTPNNMVIQSALYQVLNREQEKLHKLLEAFGLRPDARTGVTPAMRTQRSLDLVGGGSSQAPATGSAAPQGFADFE